MCLSPALFVSHLCVLWRVALIPTFWYHITIACLTQSTPLCSCPALMRQTKVLFPTRLLIRRHMDMSHNNRPVTAPRPFPPRQRSNIRYSTSLSTFDQPRVHLVTQQKVSDKSWGFKWALLVGETRTRSSGDNNRWIHCESTKLLPRQSHRFICNPAVRPDVSGLAMIREDLLKPIKDAVAWWFGQFVWVCQHKNFLHSFHSVVLSHLSPLLSLFLFLHLSQSPTPFSLRLSLTNVSLYGYSPLLSESHIKKNEADEREIVKHLHSEPGQCLCVSFLLFVEPLTRWCPNFSASLSGNLSIFPSFLLGLFLLCVIAGHVTPLPSARCGGITELCLLLFHPNHCR